MSFGEVTSANCVGFTNIKATKMYDSLGPVFKQVGTDGDTFKFGDIKVEGMDYSGTDFIQVLDSSDAIPYILAIYIDMGADSDYTGWYDIDHLWDIENKLDEQPLPAGTAFLCNMGMCSEEAPVTFKFAGEVEHGRVVTATEMYAFIANPMPVDMTLGDIKVVGMDYSGTDFIQFLDGADAVPYLLAVYIDMGEDNEYTGWYDLDHLWEIDNKIDYLPIKAGQAFLCNMGMCSESAPVDFVFPDPLAPKTAE